MIITVSDPAYLECTGCRRDAFLTYFAFGEAVIYLLMAIFVAVRARKLPDQFGMLAEGRVSLIWTLVAFLGFILVVWDPVDDSVTYDHELIITFGLVMAFFSISVWQVIRSIKFDTQANTKRNRLRSMRESKINESTSNNGSVIDSAKSVVDKLNAPKLHEIVSNEGLKAKFEKFLVTEFTQESLFFLYDTFEWRRTYYDVAPSARSARARRIVGAYVNPSGLYAINIPDARELQVRVKQSEIPIEIFDESRVEVARLLENGSVMRFRISPAYKDDVTGAEVTAAVDQMK